MQGMINRWIIGNLLKSIDLEPVVVLLGARQVGKTTLARMISAEDSKSIYVDLENPQELQILNLDISGYLKSHTDKLIILDEIQNLPDIFKVMRGLIDENRIQGRNSHQFLLLVSASMDIMRQTSQSLAGRISYLGMSGLNVLEINLNNGDAELKKLWLRGGFPNVFLSESDEVASNRLENLIRTYVERDMPQNGFNVPAQRLRTFWTMLAHLQGEPVNSSDMATNIESQRATVKFYLDILTSLLLVRKLQPWHANVKKRLVKASRYYIRDSGILHRLLGIQNFDQLRTNPKLGKSWEGFVIENIHSVLPVGVQTYYYRTSVGAEIDLVVQTSSSEIWAIDIKFGTTPKLSKHFSRTCDDVGATRKLVVYGGEKEFSIRDDIHFVPLPRIMEMVQSI